MDEYVSGWRDKRDVGKHVEQDVVCFGGVEVSWGCMGKGGGGAFSLYYYSRGGSRSLRSVVHSLGLTKALEPRLHFARSVLNIYNNQTPPLSTTTHYTERASLIEGGRQTVTYPF